MRKNIQINLKNVRENTDNRYMKIQKINKKVDYLYQKKTDIISLSLALFGGAGSEFNDILNLLIFSQLSLT